MKTCIECWFYGMGDGTCMCPYSEHLYEVRIPAEACEDYTPEEGKEFMGNYRSGLYGYTYLE